MARKAAILVVAFLLGSSHLETASAQVASDLSGRWAINRELSQFPREIGFSADWLGAATSAGDSSANAGRRGRSGGAGILKPPRESQEDATRVLRLTDEVRSPSEHLTIMDMPDAVTITNDVGQARTFHPNGKEESLNVNGIPTTVIATRENDVLTVLYKAEQGRELKYTYARGVNGAQLNIDVQFIERGGGDKVRRVYEPSRANDTAAAAPATSTPPVPTQAGAGTQSFNQQPDADLKGLRTLGVVVEELSPQAAACGLTQNALEAAVAKRLTDAGFTVRRNADDDTYVYVDVITTTPSAGLCVSRYDAYLYTHTTAKLSYGESPVLVQVSLLHKGGIAGGAAAAHADSVVHSLQDYTEQFATRIRGVNK